MSYPSSIDSFSTVTPDEVVASSYVSSIATAINAIETTLETNPNGALYPTVAAAIDGKLDVPGITMPLVTDFSLIPNTYAITLSPFPSSYTPGMLIFFRTNPAGSTNTGSCTLEINNLGAIDITQQVNEPLAAGSVQPGQILWVQYDGSYFQLFNPAVLADVSGGNGIYGDGSDGTYTVSSSAPLTRDTYYENLTVAAGATLTTAGYRLFVRNTLTCNGTIANNGENGTNGSSSGATTYGGSGALASGYPTNVGIGGAGGNGSIGTGTTGNSPSTTYSLGGDGGASTNSTEGGSTSVGAFRTSDLRWLPSAILLSDQNGNTFGGGGGGGGSAAGGSGSGGGGGGLVFIAANKILGTGSIQANGGAGGNSSSIAGDAAGGGGGGVVIVISNANAITPVALGGAGGTQLTTGDLASSGSNGTIVIQIFN